MIALLRALAGIALLRQDPSALPASIVLVVLTAIGYAAASAASSWLVIDDGHWFGRAALDLASTVVLCWLLLAATRRGHRYRQTLAAVLGTAVLLSPLAMAFQWLLEFEGTAYLIKVLAWAALLAVVIWSILIVGHILRTALEVGYLTSLALALTWLVANQALIHRVYPAVTG